MIRVQMEQAFQETSSRRAGDDQQTTSRYAVGFQRASNRRPAGILWASTRRPASVQQSDTNTLEPLKIAAADSCTSNRLRIEAKFFWSPSDAEDVCRWFDV